MQDSAHLWVSELFAALQAAQLLAASAVHLNQATAFKSVPTEVGNQ